MKIEVGRLFCETEAEGVRVTLPSGCEKAEYVLMPDLVRRSLMMLTQEEFDAFQNKCIQASAQGMRIVRMLAMNAVLAETEEGTVLIPDVLVAKTDMKTEEVWYVKDESGAYHLVATQDLVDVLKYLDRK